MIKKSQTTIPRRISDVPSNDDPSNWVPPSLAHMKEEEEEAHKEFLKNMKSDFPPSLDDDDPFIEINEDSFLKMFPNLSTSETPASEVLDTSVATSETKNKPDEKPDNRSRWRRCCFGSKARKNKKKKHKKTKKKKPKKKKSKKK